MGVIPGEGGSILEITSADGSRQTVEIKPVRPTRDFCEPSGLIQCISDEMRRDWESASAFMRGLHSQTDFTRRGKS